MHWTNWGWGGGIMMVLWWALIAVGIVAFIHWVIQQGSSQKSVSALGTLKKRYAGGKITRKEFEQMKRDIA